jgi:hypothetical protein
MFRLRSSYGAHEMGRWTISVWKYLFGGPDGHAIFLKNSPPETVGGGGWITKIFDRDFRW